MPSPHSLLRLLVALAVAGLTANAAVFDSAHQPNNRGLVHRHRRHAAENNERIKFLPRAGAAYNETDHDPSASIEIGGQQPQQTVGASSTPVASTTSTVLASTSAIATPPVSSSSPSSSSSSSLAVVSTPSASSSSVISSSTSPTSTPNPTAVVTSTQLSSSSSVTSSSSSTTIASSDNLSSSSALSSSSSTPASSTIPATQVVSTIRSIVTDSAADAASSASSTTTSRGAKTGSVSIKTASSTASSTSAAAAGGATSGISGGTKTAIIVVCVVGGVALLAFAVWTIIRKVKLRPTEKFDGRMRPLDFSPSTDAFYEKPDYHHGYGGHQRTSSADRQRRQFVDELDAADDEDAYLHGEQHVQHAQQYDMAGLPGADGGEEDVHASIAAAAGGGGGGVASSYPHIGYQQDDDQDAGYVDLRRGPSVTNSAHGMTFAGVGAGGAGLPTVAGAYNNHHGSPSTTGYYPSSLQYPDQDAAAAAAGYQQQDAYYHHQQGVLAREPSLGRPTRGEGPYAAASAFR